MKKLWLVLAIVVAVAAGGYYFASPILAFRSLAAAAEAGDRNALERHVDFPSVRDSLKDQLNDRLIGALQRDQALSQGPFGALGALLGPAIVDRVVEAAVTPEGVAAMVRSGRAPLSDVSGTAPPPPPEPQVAANATAPAEPTEPERSTRFAYLDLNHFKATTVIEDAPDAPLGWVLERRGLVGWKLVRIELPPA